MVNTTRQPMTQVFPKSGLYSRTTAGCEFLSCGIECNAYLWPDDAGWVLKVYKREECASDAASNQAEWAAAGFAPLAEDEAFPIWDTRRRLLCWAYLSEKVDTDNTSEADAEEMEGILDAAGMCMADMHSGNVGRLADGTLVAIDFGRCSMGGCHTNLCSVYSPFGPVYA